MSRIFSPKLTAGQLKGSVGIAWCLSNDFETAKLKGGLWGGSKYFLGAVIKSHLIGMNDRIDDLLLKARHWIEVAIEEKEVCGGFPPAYLCCEHRIILALCNWLQGNPDDPQVAAEAADSNNQFLSEAPDEISSTFALGLGSLIFVESKRYAEYLHWAKVNGKIPIGAPASRIRGEASVCAAICLAETDQSYKPEEISKLTRRLLDMRMNEWLTTGNALRAARWLKFYYHRHEASKLTPREVILKAYDHLPNESKP